MILPELESRPDIPNNEELIWFFVINSFLILSTLRILSLAEVLRIVIFKHEELNEVQYYEHNQRHFVPKSSRLPPLQVCFTGFKASESLISTHQPKHSQNNK